MRIKVLFFSLISSLVLLSCRNEVINNDVINKSPVLSVSVSSKTNDRVSFFATASWPNGCGSFSHTTTTKTDRIFYITVFGKEPKNAFCTTAFIEFEAPVDISVGESGSFTFRFWRSDASTFDTTITF